MKRCLSLLMILPLSATTALLNGADVEPVKTAHFRPCYILSNEQTEVAVTQEGGQMAPVVFFRNTEHPARPYHLSPWQSEPRTEMPAPVLKCLRGDFFCLPFGGNSQSVDGELHPPHGEIVGSAWTSRGVSRKGDVTTLTLSIETKIHPGRVTKALSLVQGQNVVYSRHLVEGFVGQFPLGHHATLSMPDEEGSVRIATSPLKFGMTAPGLFSNPLQREYQALLPGARWTNLTQVPVAWKGGADADLSRMPGRQGHSDLVQLVNQERSSTSGPAWTTATFQSRGYLWFALKDAAILNSTVLWMENRGRHGAPWNGRNNCLGIEDVTAFFADGLAASRAGNALSREGVMTTVNLPIGKPTAVNYIQGVAKIPSGFENVLTVEFEPGMVTFVSVTGQRISTPVRHDFLISGTL